jgi:Flagellar basal body-associated protein FliL
MGRLVAISVSRPAGWVRNRKGGQMGLLKKPPVLAAVGALGGIAVAAAVYFLFLGGGGTAGAVTPTPEPTPVFSEGKLGPRITLDDRVFNLVSPVPVYAKIQTVIEFETLDEHWADVFSGECGAVWPSGDGTRLASSAPGGVPAGASGPGVQAEDVPPCQALEAELLDEFEREIGTGRQLIEDAVTTIISSKSAVELATTEGKDALKEEIKAAVEQLIDEPPVTRVLFLNFIMQ